LIGRSRRAGLVPLAAALLVGMLTAVQSRLNSGLSQSLGNPVEAAVWSFGSGLVVLVLAVVVSPALRRGLRRVADAVRRGGLQWWQLLGGVLGGLFVGVQSGVVPLVGVAVFTVATVAGQSVNAVVVDRVGLGPAGVQPVTARRAGSAVLAIVAVVIAVSGRLGGAELSLPAVVLAVVAGCAIAVQQALNGRVAVAGSGPLPATVLNFTFGTAALVAALAVATTVGGSPMHGLGGAPWWSYLGGLVGIAFISLAAWVVTVIGVLVFAVISIAGQLSAAFLLDLVAPTPGSSVGWNLVVGLLLAFVAVAVAARGRAT
jgi:transporter family-2 protein